MPTVTRIIGTGGDDVDPIAFATWLRANAVGGTDYIGTCLNQEFIQTAPIDFSLITANSVTLTTATGASFRDNAGVRTNALSYNAANGAAIQYTGNSAAISIGMNSVTISNLQIIVNSGVASNGIIVFAGTPTPVTIQNCILQVGVTSSVSYGLQVSQAWTVRNCLIYIALSASTNALYVAGFSAIIQDVTIVTASDGTNANSGILDFGGGGPNNQVTNCAIFGCNTSINPADNSITYANCFADGSVSHTGLTSGKVYANQFLGTTSSAPDFRVKAGADLINAGTPIGGVTTDISGFTRNVSTPTVGPWEFATTGVSTPSYLYFGQATMMLDEALVWGAGAKLASDLIRNPIRSRRRLLSWKE